MFCSVHELSRDGITPVPLNGSVPIRLVRVLLFQPQAPCRHELACVHPLLEFMLGLDASKDHNKSFDINENCSTRGLVLTAPVHASLGHVIWDKHEEVRQR